MGLFHLDEGRFEGRTFLYFFRSDKGISRVGELKML